MAGTVSMTPEWLSTALGREVSSCKMDECNLDKLNTITSLRWGTVHFVGDSSGSERRIVLKTCGANNEMAKTHGLAREGLFFQKWRDLAGSSALPAEQACTLLAGFLPTVWFSEGDMASGSKNILMEDLSACVQAGYFFGGGNPNNWEKDLAEEQRGFALSAKEVVKLSFSAAAKLHASFWDCRGLLPGGGAPAAPAPADLTWLRASQWHAGLGRESWEASQAMVKQMWETAKEGLAESEVKWDPLVVECMDAAVAKTSWDAYQLELKTRPLTLTHGDFHPANFMVRPPAAAGGEHSLVMLDWEVVGVGSGPQDLGQYMISHVDPAVRAELEREAVEAYYAELTALNSSVAMTLEACWAEYVYGGLGRWLWFLPLLNSMMPAKMQFFHDQVVAFLKTHEITPATVPMPRA